MTASRAQSNISNLANNPRFVELRAKAIESKVVLDSDDDLPGSEYKGYYYDSADTTGVFTSQDEIDEYRTLLASDSTEQ